MYIAITLISALIGMSLDAFGLTPPPIFWFVGFSGGLIAGICFAVAMEDRHD